MSEAGDVVKGLCACRVGAWCWTRGIDKRRRSDAARMCGRA